MAKIDTTTANITPLEIVSMRPNTKIKNKNNATLLPYGNISFPFESFFLLKVFAKRSIILIPSILEMFRTLPVSPSRHDSSKLMMENKNPRIAATTIEWIIKGNFCSTINEPITIKTKPNNKIDIM